VRGSLGKYGSAPCPPLWHPYSLYPLCSLCPLCPVTRFRLVSPHRAAALSSQSLQCEGTCQMPRFLLCLALLQLPILLRSRQLQAMPASPLAQAQVPGRILLACACSHGQQQVILALRASQRLQRFQ